MAARTGGKFFSALFTTLVAPVAVSLMVRNIQTEEAPSQQPEAALHTANAPPADERVIAQGAGWTPEEALQQALRTALRNTAATIVAPDVWARQGAALFDTLLRDSTGLILRVQDLHSSEGWQTGRKVFYRTIAVSVARRILAERLTAAVASLGSL